MVDSDDAKDSLLSLASWLKAIAGGELVPLNDILASCDLDTLEDEV